MLKGIRSWLSSESEEAVPQDSFRQLNTVAPLKSQSKDTSADNAQQKASFICREAVLDRKERIAGYDFALGRELQSRMLEKSELIRRVYDDAMLRNLAPLGVSSLLGDRLAFIKLSRVSLNNPLLKSYANLNALVMITPGVITETDLADLRAELKHLGELGIRHGWIIDRPRPEISEILNQAELIEIKTTTFDGLQLKMIVADLRTKNAKQKIIASEIETSDDFNLCYQLGFDYFMGPFVSSRENWHPAKSEINRLKVFEALNMIRTGAEFEAIADCLRTDPVLTFKLLRYINSPGIGLLQKINDIQQALMLLGRDRFYRWLSLLLFDFNQPGYRELVLNEQALTRARFMEILAGRGGIPDAADQLFMIGLFSLLDVMMDQPLTEVLKQVSLPVAVVSALNGESGAMHDALMLGIAVESSVTENMAKAAAQCGLEAEDVSGLMIEAMSWSQQMISAASE